MFSKNIFDYSCVHEYRISLVLQIILIVMVFLDLLALVFVPVWVFFIFVVLHVVLLVFWIRAKCRLLEAFLIDLFE